MLILILRDAQIQVRKKLHVRVRKKDVSLLNRTRSWFFFAMHPVAVWLTNSIFVTLLLMKLIVL